MTYEEALQFFNSFVNYEKKDLYDYKKSFKLDRMWKLVSVLDNPQEDIRSIHVAGTKGKGSTAAFIHSILKAAGFKVGLYTSPHLTSFRERIRIGDTLISEEDVARLSAKLKAVLDKITEGQLADESFSFFEVYTALAYLYFKENKIDFAVYETGLGGRLDATNVISPLVSVITPISYEHVDILGNTLDKIAREKAGIIKDNSLCVSAPQEKEALSVIENICREKNAKLILAGRDLKFKELSNDETGESFSVSGLSEEYPVLKTRLLGAHQMVNASTAIAAVEALRFRDVKIDAAAVKKGIESCEWPGRLEIVSRKPYIALDGAQNRASANALASAIKKIFKYKKATLVLGVSSDKDIKGILEELLPISDRIVLTKSRIVERALEPEKIQRNIKEGSKGEAEVFLTSSVKEAIEKARRLSAPEDFILITGSLFVVGEARELLL